MNPDNETSHYGDQLSKRSLILEMSQMKELSKYQSSLSVGVGNKKTYDRKEKKNYNKIKRVCCIKINPNWSIKRQIFVTTMIVFVIVLSIVMLFIGVTHI